MTLRVPPRGAAPAGVLLVALLAGAPCAAGDPLDILLADLERMRSEMKIPALALTLVDRRGAIWTGAMGTADLETGRAADAETRFRIGSITKLFTAMALLIAEQDGTLALDTPLVDLVPNPSVENRWEATHPLRIVHLLEHTAGLADLSREEFDAKAPMALRDALAWKAADRRTLWPPGLHHSYSNAGAGLAALALETATAQDYEAFVARRIFEPLQMRSAGFTPDAETLATLAIGYDSDGVTPIPYWHMLYRAFGAINLRPADMAPLIQMLLNRGDYRGTRLLSAAAIDRMEHPQTTLAARAGLSYGYGLGNYAWFHHGVLFHGHGGDGDGYLAKLGYSPERGTGYFLVINVFRNRELSQLQQRIERYIAGGAEVAEAPALELGTDALAAIVGEYESVTQRFPSAAATQPPSLRIVLEKQRLYVLRGDKRRRLVPVSGTLFRYEGEPVATSAIVSYAGRLYFQGDHGSYVQRRSANLDSTRAPNGQ